MEKIVGLVKVFLILLLPNFSFAATTTGTSDVPSYSHGRHKPWTLEFVANTELSRSHLDNGFNGTYNQLNTSVIHSPTAKDDIRLYGNIWHENIQDQPSETTLELMELMYRRKNILTQKKNGVEMDMELKSYYLTDIKRRERYHFDGAFTPQFNFSYMAGHSFITTLKLRRMFYFRRDAKDTTSTGETRVYLSPMYMLTRRFFLNLQLTYKHIDKVENERKNFRYIAKDRLQVIPSVMYAFNRNVMAELYGDTYVMKSYDGKTWDPEALDNIVYGANLYITAF